MAAKNFLRYVKMLNSEILIIDLEATAEMKNGVQRHDNIIEIGAVCLDRNLEIKSKFSSLVKPKIEISKRIEELTTITNEMVKDAPEWNEVAEQFEAWASREISFKNLKTYRLSAWGTHFDIPLLRKEYEATSRKFPFSGAVIDAKTVAIMWLSMMGRNTRKSGVSTVADIMKIDREGTAHRALSDAELEAKIFKKAWVDLTEGFFINGNRYKVIQIHENTQ